MKVYRVQVAREGKWWMVAVPEIDGLTQARRLSEAERMAKDYIAVTLNIPRDSFDVNVTVEKVDGVDVASVLDVITEDRETARRLEREAGEKAERLAKELKSHGVPLRDVGTILRVSHQRAHQLVNSR
jgi:predicted RNase H-like HicB family nuclease